MTQALQTRINNKQNHIIELENIHTLLDTSYLALKAEGSDDVQSMITALSLATNQLDMEIQKEKDALSVLEAEQQGGES